MAGRSLSSMNLNHLLALDALLSERSVAKAARRIGVSPSALSHTLASLRDVFDDPLVVRGRGGMQLSARAQDLRDPLRTALRALERIVEDGPAFDPRTTSRCFRLATGDFVAARLSKALLPTMTAQAPGARLTLRPLDLASAPTALERGEVDLLIGPDVETGESLRQQPWAEEAFVAVVRGDHPLTGEVDPEGYVAWPHVVVSPTGTGSSGVDDALAEHGLTRTVACRVPSFLIAPLIVAECDVILTAPEGAVAPFVEHFGLRRFRPPVDLAPLNLAMTWHRRDDDDPGHRWFRQLLAEI